MKIITVIIALLYSYHTHCVHDLFSHIQPVYVTSTSCDSEIGHTHSLSIAEYFLTKGLFLRASTLGNIRKISD